MNDKIYKTLAKASQEIMMDKVEHIAITWTNSDGQVSTVFDKKADASFVEMLGGLEMVKARIIHTYAIMGDEDD